MKTILPSKIETIPQAHAYLKALYENGEAYHPDDPAADITWTTAQSPTPEQCTHMDTLMDEIRALDIEPCGVLLSFDVDQH